MNQALKSDPGVDSQFLDSVKEGLSQSEKCLSSRYFYDDRGSELFAQIMELPEYYLTRSEMQIFTEQSNLICRSLDIKADRLEVVELGAGDGSKTQHFLKQLLKSDAQITYRPIDISSGALNSLKHKMHTALPDLSIQILCGDYFEKLEQLQETVQQKLVLFIGSNLGNLDDTQAQAFIQRLSDTLNPGDYLLLGLDMIKSDSVVLPAYSDAAGITAEFNLNLLRRINRELDADFDLGNFKHVAEYQESNGYAKSYLQSLKLQTVTLGSSGDRFIFVEGEKIHTEISRKYSDELLAELIQGCQLTLEQKFTDSKGYFADYLLKKN